MSLPYIRDRRKVPAPTIPPEVVEAMGRVELEQYEYGGAQLFCFADPALPCFTDPELPDAYGVEPFEVGELAGANRSRALQHYIDQARSVAAQALAFLAWLDSPEGKAWSGEVSDV